MAAIGKRTLHFYFDFISPYAYFSWRRLNPFCEKHNLQLQVHPVVFGKLLDSWGQLGPAEVAPKREWLFRSCYRYASMNSFAFNPPKLHPFNPLLALRLVLLKRETTELQHAIIDAIFKAGWSGGADLSDPNTLTNILDTHVLSDGSGTQLVADAQTNIEVKDALRMETSKAIEQGVFGVPTFIVNNELFWGNDQFDQMELVLSGQDPLLSVELSNFSDRKRGIDRKHFLATKDAKL
eukprot:m.342061 g.342061  ORF g.342061 m.342061 type:complete len:237 (+) comp20852_c0_seq1:120-830(+)